MKKTLLVTDHGAWVKSWAEEAGHTIDAVHTVDEFSDMLKAGLIDKSYQIIGDLPFSISSQLCWRGLGVDYHHMDTLIVEYKGDSYCNWQPAD